MKLTSLVLVLIGIAICVAHVAGWPAFQGTLSAIAAGLFLGPGLAMMAIELWDEWSA